MLTRVLYLHNKTIYLIAVNYRAKSAPRLTANGITNQRGDLRDTKLFTDIES